MKNIFLLLFFSTCFFGFSQKNQKDVVWLQNYEKVQKIAKKENKSILMYFSGSDWCMPCKKLKQDFFDTEKFKKYTSSFVLMLVDVPRNKDLITKEQREQNFKLLEKYNPNKSFPLVTILSTKGDVLDKISGYSSLRDTRFHFELLDKFSK